MPKLYLIRIWRGCIILAVVLTTYLLFRTTFVYIYPFLIAAFLSFLLNPFVSALQFNLKIPRPLATFFVICCLMIFVIGAAFLILTEIFQGTLYLADRLPTYFQSFVKIVDTFVNTKVIPIYQDIVSLFYSLTPAHQETIIDYVQQLNSYIATKGASVIQNFFIQIPALLTLLPSSLTVVIFTILGTFFITNDWEYLKEKIYKLIPGVKTLTQDFFSHFKTTIINYLKAQLILIFISGCMIYSGLLILKIDHALTISIFTAFIDLLPVLGTGIVFIPWILYLFITENYPLTIGLIILYMLVIIVRQLLEPKILTASVGLNPLVGLIILFVSLQTLGGVGLILTPFILIFIAVFQKSGLTGKIITYIKG